MTYPSCSGDRSGFQLVTSRQVLTKMTSAIQKAFTIQGKADSMLRPQPLRLDQCLNLCSGTRCIDAAFGTKPNGCLYLCNCQLRSTQPNFLRRSDSLRKIFLGELKPHQKRLEQHRSKVQKAIDAAKVLHGYKVEPTCHLIDMVCSPGDPPYHQSYHHHQKPITI